MPHHTAPAFCLSSTLQYDIIINACFFTHCRIVLLTNLHINDTIIKFHPERAHSKAVVMSFHHRIPLKCTWEWHFKVNRAYTLGGFEEETRVSIMVLESLGAAAAVLVEFKLQIFTGIFCYGMRSCHQSPTKSSTYYATVSVIQSKIDIFQLKRDSNDKNNMKLKGFQFGFKTRQRA